MLFFRLNSCCEVYFCCNLGGQMGRSSILDGYFVDITSSFNRNYASVWVQLLWKLAFANEFEARSRHSRDWVVTLGSGSMNGGAPVSVSSNYLAQTCSSIFINTLDSKIVEEALGWAFGVIESHWHSFLHCNHRFCKCAFLLSVWPNILSCQVCHKSCYIWRRRTFYTIAFDVFALYFHKSDKWKNICN